MIEELNLLLARDSLRQRIGKHKIGVSQAIYSNCDKEYQGHKYKHHRVGADFDKQVKFAYQSQGHQNEHDNDADVSIRGKVIHVNVCTYHLVTLANNGEYDRIEILCNKLEVKNDRDHQLQYKDCHAENPALAPETSLQSHCVISVSTCSNDDQIAGVVADDETNSSQYYPQKNS